MSKQYKTKIPSKYPVTDTKGETPSHLVLHIVLQILDYNDLLLPRTTRDFRAALCICQYMIDIDKIPQVDMNEPVTRCSLTVRREK